MIQVQVDDPVGDALRQGELVVGFQVRDIDGRNAGDHVDIAGQQRGNPRRARFDRLERDLFPDRLVAPEIVVAGHDDPVGGHIFGKLERSGSDCRRSRVELFRRRAALSIGDDRQCRDVIRHQRVGRLGLDMDRHIVDLGKRLALRVGGKARR